MRMLLASPLHIIALSSTTTEEKKQRKTKDDNDVDDLCSVDNIMLSITQQKDACEDMVKKAGLLFVDDINVGERGDFVAGPMQKLCMSMPIDGDTAEIKGGASKIST